MRITEHLSRWVNRPAEWLAISMLLLMLACVLLQVVGRYAFQNPPAWTEEAARFAMVWCGLLGASSALLKRMDPKLSAGIQAARGVSAGMLKLGRWLAVTLFTLPWIIYGPGFVVRHWYRVTDSLEWNSALVVLILPIAGCILFVYACVQLLEKIKDAKEIDASPPEADGI